jgi:hypothetical protein
MDLARAPCRARLTARKKGSGYENAMALGTRLIINWIYPIKTHGERLGASLNALPTELRGQIGSSMRYFGSESCSFDITVI